MYYVIWMCKIVKRYYDNVEANKALFDSFCFSAEYVYFIVSYAYEMDNEMCLF